MVKKTIISASVCLIGLVCTISVFAQNYHGVIWANSYENDWNAANDYRGSVCTYFASRMSLWGDSETRFSASMEGQREVNSRYYNEGDGATGGLDTVDIFMSCSHGDTTIIGDGSTPLQNFWSSTMWAEWEYAKSKFMRFGDEGRGLSIFTSYDCKQMTDDPYLSIRWGGPFKGGLRYASAFKGYSYNQSDNAYIGQEYADRLHSGQSLKYAWLDSMDRYTLNTPAVMSAGPDSTTCKSRRDNMTWDNFKNYTRYRDDQADSFCRTSRVP